MLDGTGTCARAVRGNVPGLGMGIHRPDAGLLLQRQPASVDGLLYEMPLCGSGVATPWQ